MGPAEGKLSTAISTLLWRGMIVGKSPQELQMISWSIQGSVPYSKMPEQYQKTIDQLVPEFKGQLDGQGFAKIQNTFDSVVASNVAKYNKIVKYARWVPVSKIAPITPPIIQPPTLDTVLARLGTLGRLALDGEKQAKLITANYASEQLREKAVFAGQGSALPPIPAENGPWVVKIPNVAYMRFRVASGNMASDNVMEIRILPPAAATTTAQYGRPHLVLASFGGGAAVPIAGPSFPELFGGTIERRALSRCLLTGEDAPLCVALTLTLAGTVGYAINHGAQAPVISPPAVAMAGNGGSDLTDDKGKKHILDGDNTGGGHRPGTGIPNKSEFPSSWSDDKILEEISDVATDPALDLPPVLRQMVKTQNSSNGELSQWDCLAGSSRKSSS